MAQFRRDNDKYVLRFPDGMREAIKKEAKRNNRSMNAEIIYRVRRAYEAMEAESHETAS